MLKKIIILFIIIVVIFILGLCAGYKFTESLGGAGAIGILIAGLFGKRTDTTRESVDADIDAVARENGLAAGKMDSVLDRGDELHTIGERLDSGSKTLVGESKDLIKEARDALRNGDKEPG